MGVHSVNTADYHVKTMDGRESMKLAGCMVNLMFPKAIDLPRDCFYYTILVRFRAHVGQLCKQPPPPLALLATLAPLTRTHPPSLDSLTLFHSDERHGVCGTLYERYHVLLDHSGHSLAVHLQNEFAIVQLSTLVADPILPNLSHEGKQACLRSPFDVQAKVPLLVAADETLVRLDTPMLALEGVRPLGGLGHLGYFVLG